MLSLALASCAAKAQTANWFPGSGPVDIGTTSPAAELDINGDLAIKGAIVNSVNPIPVTTDGTYVIASGARIKGTYTLNFETANRTHTVVLVANATVYDGTGSLSILSNTAYSGSVVMSNFRLLFNSDLSAVYLAFDITNRNGGTLVTVKFDGNGYNSNYGPNWGGTLPASPVVGGVYPLSINSGNVIIGRTTQNNPIYRLDVFGSARANSITVNAVGADFVFESTYKLYSLPALKKYIDQNHHLPEIPSAKEMQKDGLNVGENQVKLLQKVEALTLYLIQKDEKEKQQQQKIETQETQLQLQQKELIY